MAAQPAAVPEMKDDACSLRSRDRRFTVAMRRLPSGMTVLGRAATRLDDEASPKSPHSHGPHLRTCCHTMCRP
jgi:hypothetical protein